MSNEATPADDAQPALERRLATILSSDVAGYSRLMGEDEERTVQTFRGHRAVFDALLKQHHGRIFNTAGDAILAEFPSAVEAVRCATEIQMALQTRNEHLPPEHRMLFRMGINLGDVVVQGSDLLGDGVNVASRIQTVAEPGGICISGSVYDQIQNKLSLQFKPLGDQLFKNIHQPVRTFTITHGEGRALPSAARRAGGGSARAIVGAAVIAAVLAGGGYWFYSDREAKRMGEETLNAQLAAEKRAAEDARQTAQEQSRRAAEAEGRAERERLVTEATKREAALQAQLQSADEARRRAEAERKRVDEERQRAEADKRAAEGRAEAERRATEARAEAGKRQRATTSTASIEGSRGTATGATQPAAGGSSVDAAYVGQFCNFPANPGRKFCWRVPLKFQNGVATPTWASRVAGKYANARVTIDQAGVVKVTLDGWNSMDGSPLTGTLSGRLADDRIDVEGRWANGAPIEGHWTRAP